MKKFPHFIIAGVILILLISCNSQSFITANNMRNIYGTLYLKNGSTVTGYLSVTPFSRNIDYVTVKQETKGDKQRIYTSELEGFTVRGDYYALIETDDRVLRRGERLFARRMTQSNSKIHLYELEERNPNNQIDNNGNVIIGAQGQGFTYYVQFPFQSRYEVWRLDGKQLVPNFDEKMSESVKDKPVLAQKIRNKEKGYFYALITGGDDRRLETMQRIITEYNAP